jgi:hypothetical protein
MWFSSDHRGVRIFVRGEFVAPRRWLIHATVAGAASRGRTLSELWQAIALERRLGRHLGAVDTRVVVDGDGDIANWFATNKCPGGSPERVDPSTLQSVAAAPLVATDTHSV